MAWGIKTKSDGKFWPIFYIKNFSMGKKNSDSSTGELILEACNIVLSGIGTGIQTGNILIHGDPGGPGIYFEDISTGSSVLSIMPKTLLDEAMIYILDNIVFYKNASGSYTLKLGESCFLTDDGTVYADKSIGGTNAEMYCKELKCYGHIYCNNGVEPFSLEEKKKNIKKYNHSALNEVVNTDIYTYNYKEDEKGTKKRVGAIIGKKYNISKEIIGTEGKGIDLYSMVSVAYKAIQEQQEQIEQLQAKDKQKDEIIQSLIKRIETLEKEVNR